MSVYSDYVAAEMPFYQYTKQWTEIVNRGGLFEINEVSFMLFRAIEAALLPHLQSTLLESAKALESESHCREHLVSVVMSDEEVLFHWSLCSLYIDNEDDSRVIEAYN